MKINLSDFKFTSLNGVSFIDNCFLPILDYISLSISKNKSGGLWYVGEDNSFQVGVQVLNKSICPYHSLIRLHEKNSNVIDDCDINEINYLFNSRCAKLSYGGHIEVFTSWDGKEKEGWFFRHFFTKDEKLDLDEKIEYSKIIFGSDKVRVIK